MVIEIEGLDKEYHLGQQRIRALDGVNLDVAEGEFIAIMGASGSGKSTLLNIIGGLDRPTRGRVVVGGESLAALNEAGLSRFRQRRVGFIFQKFNLMGAYTAIENVEFPLMLAGVPEAKRRVRAAGALAAVGLPDRHHHRPSELSGGQQQRVAVARALVNDPDVLLADEPTGNLDSQTSSEILGLLAEICAGGRTVLLVTHDERLAGQAHRVVQMHDGRLLPEPRAAPAGQQGFETQRRTAGRLEKAKEG